MLLLQPLLAKLKELDFSGEVGTEFRLDPFRRPRLVNILIP